MADLSITASDVLPVVTTSLTHGIAGLDIGAGYCVYVDSDDSNKVKPARANTAAAAYARGIAINTAYAGQPITYIFNQQVILGSILTQGEIYVVSYTAGGGKICPHSDLTAGQYVTVLGIAVSSTTLNIVINVSGVTHG